MADSTLKSVIPTRRRTTSRFFWVLIAVAAAAYLFNPLGYVMEAGSSAYYQARMAHLRGDASAKAAIGQALKDGKITQREYSDVVFPLYLKTVNAAEDPFPEIEKAKSKDQQRAQALAVVGLS